MLCSDEPISRDGREGVEDIVTCHTATGESFEQHLTIVTHAYPHADQAASLSSRPYNLAMSFARAVSPSWSSFSNE